MSSTDNQIILGAIDNMNESVVSIDNNVHNICKTVSSVENMLVQKQKEDENVAKQLDEAMKMIELMKADKRRNEEKERKNELKEYAMTLGRTMVLRDGGHIFNTPHILWDSLSSLDETLICLSSNGTLLLTDKNLYKVNYWNPYNNYGIARNDANIVLFPLYTFDKPLNIKDLSIFGNREIQRMFSNINFYESDKIER